MIHAERDSSATPWGWLAVLTGAGLVLRSIGLNGGLWYDEIVTLDESVRQSLWQIVTAYPSNTQHTLFAVLAHLSIVAFGEHPWSLRLPAMLLGVATIPALYLFGREIAGRTEALLASLLLAVAYHHVWFSQNARGYTTMAFLTVLSSWLLLRGLRHGRTSDFIWYGIAIALSVYTHLTMVFLGASHAALCLLPLRVRGIEYGRPARRQLFIGFGLAGLLTILLYLPLLGGMEQFFVKREHHTEVATAAWALQALLAGLRIGVAGWTAALAGGALVCAGLWSYLQRNLFVAGLLILPGIVTVAGTIVLGQPLLPRFLFFAAGFAVLILVRGAVEAGRLSGQPLVGLTLIAGMAVASAPALAANYRYPKQDFDGALRFAEERRAPDEPIVTVGATTIVYRDHYGRDFPAAESLVDLQRIRDTHRRVWVVHTLDESIAVEVPDLMRALDSDCVVAATFRGTLGQGNGDITICTISSSAPPDRAAGTTK